MQAFLSTFVILLLFVLPSRVEGASAEDFRASFAISQGVTVRHLLIPQIEYDTLLQRLQAGDVVTVDRWCRLLDRVGQMSQGADASSLAMIYQLAKGDTQLLTRQVDGRAVRIAVFTDTQLPNETPASYEQVTLANLAKHFERGCLRLVNQLDTWDAQRRDAYLTEVFKVANLATATNAQKSEANEQVRLGWGVHVGMEMDQLEQ